MPPTVGKRAVGSRGRPADAPQASRIRLTRASEMHNQIARNHSEAMVKLAEMVGRLTRKRAENCAVTGSDPIHTS
jgi:hypothetical protein